MKYIGVFITGVILFIAGALGLRHGNNAVPVKKIGTMIITSTAFGDNTSIPKEYTCDGKAGHPPLAITQVPAEAKSLALTMDDPDAPIGTFHHWLIWNVPTQTTEVPAGVTPAGSIEGTNGAGKVGYIGPCPPAGTHRYIFTLYALDVMLDLPPATKMAQLESGIKGHSIAQTQLTGTYRR